MIRCIKCSSPTKTLLCDDCAGKEAQYTIHNKEEIKAEFQRRKEKILSENKEQVDHPKHYNHGKFEVIDVIEDWGVDFHIGNVIKYVSRAGRKTDDTEIQDLKKALWYLQRKIELLEKKDV